MSIETHNSNLDPSLMILYRSVFILVLVGGLIVNYKLFDSIKKETVGSKGKVFQMIIKHYAIIQSISWPCIGLTMMLLVILTRNFGEFVNPCVVVYGTSIVHFWYFLLRYYVGLTSLILATGRYICLLYTSPSPRAS